MKWFAFILLSVAFFQQGYGQATVPLWKTMPDPPALPRPDDSGRITIAGGAALFYAVYNSKGKDPVLLLHGGLSSSDVWGFEVPLLATTHKVIVTDTRGHGRSTMPDEPFSYRAFASDILIILDSLHIPKTSIVGWSDGGITGLLLAMYYPQRVDKLFTYGANFNHSGEKQEAPDTAMSLKYMTGAKANYQKLSPTPEGFATLRKSLRALYGNEPNLDTNAIKKIKAPTVIACGAYEQFYTREHFQQLARMIPRARLVVIPDVSHNGPLQDPVNFHKEVVGLLER